MNIQKIIAKEIKYNYLNRVQDSLSEYGLTLSDLQTYKRVGTSIYGVPDFTYDQRFGKDADLPDEQEFCLCGHGIVQQCYLMPENSNDINDIITVGNRCVKRWGFNPAVRGDPNKKVECNLCGARVRKSGLSRHQKRPCCKNNIKQCNNDNDTASTTTGGSSD